MSLAAAKAAIRPIQKDLTDVIGPILPMFCNPAEATSASQFEARTIRLQGFLLAYGVEAAVIDSTSVMIAQAWDEHDEMLIVNPGYSLH